jgi:hypothetical protein
MDALREAGEEGAHDKASTISPYDKAGRSGATTRRAPEWKKLDRREAQA